MRVVIAPDSFGGTLDPVDAAAAIVEGWLDARPDDELEVVPLSDGGEGLLDVLARPDDTWFESEVAGPRGQPVVAPWVLGEDGTAVIESARACGLSLLAEEDRDPLATTSYGVGELLEEARAEGARHIIVGLGGSATVDGGAGALTAVGFRLRVADGSGLKIGGGELHRVATAERDWVDPTWAEVGVVVLCDVATPLLDAAATFGPQKGADEEAVEQLQKGIETWADIAEYDLAGGTELRDEPGTGAAGGLSFGLAAGLGADLRPGAPAVVSMVDLAAAVAEADLVVTGEGRLDATSFEGKVVGEVVTVAQDHGCDVAAVVGRAGVEDGRLAALVEAAPAGAGGDPFGEVAAAARKLAAVR